jgi:site-specific recombinase XerD
VSTYLHEHSARAAGTELARFEDVRLDRDHHVALGYLARYRNPTRGLYEISLRQWFEWCASRGMRPLEATRVHLEVYARELEEVRGLKVSTVANKLNTLCGFYKFAKLDRVIVDNPAEFLRRPAVPNESTRVALNRGELLRIMDAAAAIGDHEHALICTLALLGPRIGELCALDVEDLGWQGGYRTLRLRREKGNRSADVPLAPRLTRALDLYLGSRTTGPLFRKRTGERIDRKAAARVVTRVVKHAGIAKHITPHSLRHSFITIALNSGVSIRDLQNSMGYADARQIARYDRDKDSLARHATWMVSAAVEGA